jgi:hypothetical protein
MIMYILRHNKTTSAPWANWLTHTHTIYKGNLMRSAYVKRTT